jgi:hypothetical protein
MSTQPGGDRIERAAFGFMASLDAEHIGLKRFSENALSEICQDSDGWTFGGHFFVLFFNDPYDLSEATIR